MDLRVTLPDSEVAELRRRLGCSVRAETMVRDAMTLFCWAASEHAAGRVVISADADGQNVKRLALRSLSVEPAHAE